MHQTISPAILYWGTPVIIISTTNEDGTTNLAPMSSAWWLAQRCMLGLAAQSQTTVNLRRTKQCVLNLPSDALVPQINALAKTTGREDMSAFKKGAGYCYVKDKFDIAGLTAMPSETVEPTRVEECPVQMEAELVAAHEMCRDKEGVRVHAEEGVLQEGKKDKVDTDRWRPLIMSFQQFYGLGPRLQKSRLAEIDEERYR